MPVAVTRRLQEIPPSASLEEAAAIVAALQRFTRATALLASQLPSHNKWRTTAILEGVSREPWGDIHHPWVDTAQSPI